MPSVSALLKGDSLRARALRGTAFTFLGFGMQQFLRLLSNLILTRLLFPEAFGLMALVNVILLGLQMFSDVGSDVAIVRSKRGDDPIFLNTAWIVHIGRGLLLGVMATVLAVPAAQFYNEPQLAELLPAAGLNTIILGFQSTKLAVVNRSLMLGRLTLLEFGSQIAGIVTMIALAYLTESVWSLLIGVLVTSSIKVILSHVMLPGSPNRFAWETAAFWELFHFGKYIFISSIAGFAVNNADRAVLGKFISMGALGIYNIGFFPASIPFILTRQFGSRILLPIYTKTPPKEGPENRRKIRLARGLLTGGLVLLGLGLGLIGEWFIHLLYEEEYALAGPIMVLVSLAYLPVVVTNAYGQLFLAEGHSRDFTIQLIVLALVQFSLVLIGVQAYGMIGAIVAPGLGVLLIYPLTAWFAHRLGGWDPLMDALFLVLIVIGSACVLWFNDTALPQVIGLGIG